MTGGVRVHDGDPQVVHAPGQRGSGAPSHQRHIQVRPDNGDNTLVRVRPDNGDDTSVQVRLIMWVMVTSEF